MDLELEKIISVKISNDLFEELIKYAEANRKIEVCAVLFGQIIGDEAKVVKASFLKNIADSISRFKIDPIELYEVYLQGEKENLDIVSIFHSHLAIPYPSKIDQYYMGLNPVPWLIIGLIGENWVVKGFKLINGRIIPVAVEIEE
jgi:proteasome lid subunit RPN8/RPN11